MCDCPSDNNRLLLEPIQQVEEDYEERKNQIAQSSLGKRFYRWRDRLERTLFRSTYRAYDCDSGRQVQWNRIPLATRSLSQRRNIAKDIRTMRQVDHANILAVVDSWLNRSHRQVVYITEAVGGWTLRRHIQKLQRCKLKIVKGWALQILSALEYLHSKNIVHCGVRCDNIYVDTITNELKLGEIGHVLTNTQNMHPVFGEPRSTAPECFEDVWTPASDIYSFGMILLEIITGRLPYSECSNFHQLYRKICHGKRPQAVDDIQHADLRNIINSCLGKERLTAQQLIEHPFWRSVEQTDNHPVVVSANHAATERSIESSEIYLRRNMRNTSIQTVEDEYKANLQRYFHHAEKVTKQGDTIFSITSERNRKLEFRIQRTQYQRDEYQELVSFLWSKLDENASPKTLQRDEQTTAEQTKSYFDIKRLEMLCESRAKEDSCHQRLLYEELTNDLLGKARERFANMYESYRQGLDATLFLNLPQDIVEARHIAQRRELEQQQMLDKDRRRLLKRNSKGAPYPASQSSVTNLIDILNNDGYMTTAIDQQDREAFKNVLHNDEILTFNFDTDAWDELGISFHERVDSESLTSQLLPPVQPFKSTHEIFVIRESGEEKSESKSKGSADD